MLLFKSSAAKSRGRKRLSVAGDSKKRTFPWNQEVKDAIRAKKDMFKTLLPDRLSLDLQSRYSEARKAVASAVKKFKKSLEEVWLSIGFQLFLSKQSILQTIRRLRGQTLSVAYSIKDYADNIITDENEIL